MLLSVDPGQSEIGTDILEAHKEEISAADYLLIHSGWDRYWGQKNYFGEFPVLSLESAVMLASWGLKGVGLDMISVDPVDAPGLPVHHVLFEKDFCIIENLKGLDRLPADRDFGFFCYPLNIHDADGSPVRAGAVLD